MKGIITMFLLLMFPVLNAIAQNTESGIYKSFADYKNNKLSYTSDCSKEEHSIKLNDALSRNFISVEYEGKKIKLQKDSIYGILDCKGSLIRFQDGDQFFLAEKGPIWIFYKNVAVTEGKISEVQKRYYFTTKGDGRLVDLTISHVKSAFSGNVKLCSLIDGDISGEADISAYDSDHKMFKINYLISSSK